MKPPLNTAELFTPGRLGPYTLPHRVLMAPMTRNRARRDGVPSPSAVIYYAQRASAGMIVTETTTVSEQAVGYPFMPGIHTADQVAGWTPVVDAVHRFGCRLFLQLFHAGRVSHPSLQPGEALPVAPSPIAPNGQKPTYQGPTPFVPPRVLALAEIPDIVEQFRVVACEGGVGNLVGLLDRVRHDRLLRLRAVPRAVAAQALGQPLELDQRVVKRGRLRGHYVVAVLAVDVSAAHGSGDGWKPAPYLICEPLQ